MSKRFNATPFLLAFGLGAFAIAGLSILDMYRPRPYDGVVLDAYQRDQVVVREVMSGSGADQAGIRPGDVIVGLGREMIRNADDAGRILNRMRIGDTVPYLVRTDQGPEERMVTLSRRTIGDITYLYASVLGFAFFLVGLFVLVRQPTLRVSQVFFLLCGLMLLFLVCKIRPASYSGVDGLILGIGTFAFFLLAPAFLHFYLLFPRPAWLESITRAARRRGRPTAWLWNWGWLAIYLPPPLMWLGLWLVMKFTEVPIPIAGGVPVVSWWLFTAYIALGLLALVANARELAAAKERQGMALVLMGSLFGLLPFLVSILLFTGDASGRRLFTFGVIPLTLVPLTFAYAIVRFQLLDIRVMLRRSLLYTVTTVFVTGLYAFGIAAFNAIFADSEIAASAYFPLILALAIILLFEPLRRRIQEPIDNFFFAERKRLQHAMVDLGEAMTDQADLEAVVHELVAQLPRILGLHFAGLYLLRGYRHVRAAGPDELPAELPLVSTLQRHLQRRRGLTRLDQLGALALRSTEVMDVVGKLEAVGVEALGDLSSRRRHIGLVVLSAKQGQISLEREELQLLDGLLRQVSLALETNLLITERSHQAELQRELEIAANIQAELLPDQVRLGAGWRVAAACRPARDVGGDFYAELPQSRTGRGAVVFADVSGKSVSGALLMMAAHEVLHALSLSDPEPGSLFSISNRRLYALGKRRFVALGYLSASEDGERLRYLLAGQPPLLLRRHNGEVVELPLAEHRIPLGALPEGHYLALEADVAPGDVVLGYSDGVLDACSPDGEIFGEERLFAALASAVGGPEEVVSHVEEELEAFTRGARQYDDVTLIAVSRSAQSTEIVR
ncbi:MAG: SpoIIE family protein phosphatase [Acidobacteriota bacterium]